MALPKGPNYILTARDILRDWLEWCAAVQGKNVLEKDSTITVIPGGPKYIFYPDGELKSVIKAGESYGPRGKNKDYRPQGLERREGK